MSDDSIPETLRQLRAGQDAMRVDINTMRADIMACVDRLEDKLNTVGTI